MAFLPLRPETGTGFDHLTVTRRARKVSGFDVFHRSGTMAAKEQPDKLFFVRPKLGQKIRRQSLLVAFDEHRAAVQFKV
jgi:hypothetical protein